MGRDLFHQPRVLQAPSNLALDTAREGAATASLDSLGQCLTTLTLKNFFLISNLNLPFFSSKLSPLVLSPHMIDEHVHSTFPWAVTGPHPTSGPDPPCIFSWLTLVSPGRCPAAARARGTQKAAFREAAPTRRLLRATTTLFLCSPPRSLSLSSGLER